MDSEMQMIEMSLDRSKAESAANGERSVSNNDSINAQDDTIPYLRLIFDQGYCTTTVLSQQYSGQGTTEDPFIVTWLDGDPRNPQNWSFLRKSLITLCLSLTTLASALSSSAYTGATIQIQEEFNCSAIVVTLGLSLFVLGFAIGPLVWAPLSELYGRHIVFVIAYALLTAFNAGAAGAHNIHTLIILRFFSGVFGSSSNANAGGQVVDMWGPEQRGLAMSLLILTPFVGPALGPIAGGFLGETVGWRWTQGFLGIFAGAMCLLGGLGQPETYAPVLLKKRAQKLSKNSGRVYMSKLEVNNGHVDVKKKFATALGRPWLLLVIEMIVLLLSVWIGIIYGTLYMFFSAFPIVFGDGRHWSEGLVGLSFLGVAVGMSTGVAYAVPENIRYNKLMTKSKGKPIFPEQRLIPAMVAAPFVPIGLFWFAWASSPGISPFVCIASGIPFGFGMVTIYLSITNYLVDGYTIYAASAIAANALLRTLCGVAFPLFAEPMYDNLGIHWASSIPAFLAIACVPLPFVIFRWGEAIRKRSRYAGEAERIRLLVQGK